MAGNAEDIDDGLVLARRAIDRGAARQALSHYVETTQELAA